MKEVKVKPERYHLRVVHSAIHGRKVKLELYDDSRPNDFHPGNEIFLERPDDLQHLSQAEACGEMTRRMVAAGRI